MPKKQGTVMIVDDTTTNLMLLHETLKDDYDVITANLPSQALEMLRNGTIPDIILLDIVMPEMDGYSFCHLLKQELSTRNIPVIFLTAKDSPEDEVKGLAMGAVDYISKPYVVPIMKARINTHIDLKRKYDLLESLVMLDGLTEIPNRRFLDENLEKEWRRNLRSEQPLSCIMIDIDYFKQYNDNYGHLSGDYLLKEVASAIKLCLNRGGDFVVRYGGEEFAVFLPETEINTAYLMAEKIQRTINELKIPHAHSSVSDYLTLSMGIACLVPEINITPEDLINRADDNLYAAKKTGRNKIVKEII